MNWTETSGLGSDDTKRALRELVALGLDDEIYRNFVHLAGHSISDMLGYEVASMSPTATMCFWTGSWSGCLGLNREWRLPPGRKDVHLALAKACKVGMRQVV